MEKFADLNVIKYELNMMSYRFNFSIVEVILGKFILGI